MMERDDIDDDYAPETEDQDSVDEEQAQLDAQLSGSNPLDQANLSPLHEDSIPEEWRLPPGLDPEWIAFEVYNEDEGSDTESEGEAAAETPLDPDKMANLSLKELSLKDQKHSTSPSPSQVGRHVSHSTASTQTAPITTTVSNSLFEHIRTSLSLLEMLLRLTSLQQFQQQSHLSISDELLNFFLEESSSTGAGGDEQHRQRLRSEARRRVGWDPYDESPVKHRGEDYQYGWGPGSPREGDEIYSPGGGSRGFQTRSREGTPETPLRRGSPGVRPSGLRDMTPAYSDDASLGRSSPLGRKASRAP
jgi:hypothetical protein